jgi:hypothetical protein
MPAPVVSDHYRCPQNFLDFALSGLLSSDEGYFRFGPDAICYGRSCAGTRSPGINASLDDILEDVRIEAGTLYLPFDPQNVVENLLLERYLSAGRQARPATLKKLYYVLRPLTNLAMRRRIQRFHARNWKESSFPKWPVDTTVEDIREKLLLLSMKANGVESVPFIWFWPDGATGCFMMTHDVETRAGRDYCPRLMDIDDSFGIKASFEIVPEERYTVPSSLLELMRARGFEIEVQDLNHDGCLFDDKTEFLRRAKLVNRYGREFGALGFRAAALYRRPEWYDALEFAFDMSFPNVAPLDPQRGGCCSVMPFFIGDILELPVTTTQDYTLFHLLNQRSIGLWTAQIDRILKKHGLVSFIIHPDYIMEAAVASIYEQLLNHLRSLHQELPIWFALPAAVNSWWRDRSKMSLVKDGNSWKIHGDDTGRAVLAYAKSVDGSLVYELAKPRVEP